jgi:hypothetical protein
MAAQVATNAAHRQNQGGASNVWIARLNVTLNSNSTNFGVRVQGVAVASMVNRPGRRKPTHDSATTSSEYVGTGQGVLFAPRRSRVSR